MIKHHKFVAALPASLEADSVYFIRVGTGFDLHVTNHAGVVVAYSLNIPASVAEALAQKVDKVDGKGLSTEDFTGAEKIKLSQVAPGATANDTDANLKDRANHTGTQPISATSGLQDALDAKQPTQAGKGLSTNDFTTTEKQKLAGIAPEATANASDAALRDRGTHTGTQGIGTVSGLQSALDAKQPAEAGKGLSTNDFTTAEKTKLSGLESSHFRGSFISLAALNSGVSNPRAGDYADVDQGTGYDVMRYIYDVNDAKWVPQRSATSLTAAEVKTLYESNPDTNAFTNGYKTKLDGIDTGATANASNAQLRDRSTHTGTQGIETVVNLQVTLDGKVNAVSGKQLSTEDYSTAEKSKLSNIAANATANDTNANLRDRSTHTGTQAISTVVNLQTTLDGKAASTAALTALGGLTPAADRLPYFSGAAGAALATFTAQARTLLAAATQAAQRIVLGLIPQTSSTDTTAGSLLTVGAFGLGTLGDQATVANVDATTTPAGLYRTAQPAGTLPTGAGTFGTLLVERYRDIYLKQTYSENGSGLYPNAVFVRTYNGGTGLWLPWERLATGSMLLDRGAVNLVPSEYCVFGAVLPTTYRNSGLALDAVADAAAQRNYALRVTTSTATSTTFALAPGIDVGSLNLSYRKQKYLVSFWAKSDTDGHVIGAYLRALRADGVTVATSAAPTVALTTGWARYSMILDATPAAFDGSLCQLAIQPNRSAVSGRVIYFDRFMLEPVADNVNEPSSFCIGNSNQESALKAPTASPTFTGGVGIGGDPNGLYMLNVSGTPQTAGNQYGVMSACSFGATGYSSAYGGRVSIPNQASATTIALMAVYTAIAPVLGTNVSVTEHDGFRIDGVGSTAVAIAYAINLRQAVQAGYERWNVYCSGSAPNYMNGDLRIGTTTQDGSAKLTVAGAATVAGNFTVNDANIFLRNASGSPAIVIDAPAGSQKFTSLRSGNLERWRYGVSSVAESGSNAGSDFFISRYDDTGSGISTPLSIARATAMVTLAQLTVNGATLSVGPLRPGSYTLTTLPSASTYQNYVIIVSNATGGAKLCYSNGTNWCLINTSTVVS